MVTQAHARPTSRGQCKGLILRLLYTKTKTFPDRKVNPTDTFSVQLCLTYTDFSDLLADIEEELCVTIGDPGMSVSMTDTVGYLVDLCWKKLK